MRMGRYLGFSAGVQPSGGDGGVIIFGVCAQHTGYIVQTLQHSTTFLGDLQLHIMFCS